MAVCSAFDANGPYLRNLIDFVDCHAMGLGELGYRALGAGSVWSQALTGLLTIAIAIVGYRMLAGRSVRISDGLTIALRIGIVLALATQWSAYRPLVFDLVMQGPNELASILVGGNAWGTDGGAGLVDRVQNVSSAMDAMVQPPVPPVAPPEVEGEGAGASAAVRSPAIGLTADQRESLRSANGMMLVANLAVILPVHIVAGLFLALGPVFVACLLFEALHGFLTGWIRLLAGTALAAVGAPVAMALQLSVVEPQVRVLAEQMVRGRSMGPLLVQTQASIALFAIVMLAIIVSAIIVATGFRLPLAIRGREPSDRRSWHSGGDAAPLAAAASPSRPVDGRSRAQGIADAVAVLDRREQRISSARANPMSYFQPFGADRARGDEPAGSATAPSSGRRTLPRRSASGNRRDQI